MANGNHDFGASTSPRVDEQYPVRPFYTRILAILPYVKARFLSNRVGMAHLP